MTFILDKDTGNPLRASICTKVMRKALCALETATIAFIEAGGRSAAYTKKLHKYARAIYMISSIIMGRENWNHNLWVRAKSRRDKVFRAMIRAEIGQKAIRAWHLREEKAQGFHQPSSCHPGPRAGISPFAASYEIPGQARDDSSVDAPAYEWKPYGLFPQTGLPPTTRATINPGTGSPRPRAKPAGYQPCFTLSN